MIHKIEYRSIKIKTLFFVMQPFCKTNNIGLPKVTFNASLPLGNGQYEIAQMKCYQLIFKSIISILE